MGISTFTSKEFIIVCRVSKIGNGVSWRWENGWKFDENGVFFVYCCVWRKIYRGLGKMKEGYLSTSYQGFYQKWVDGWIWSEMGIVLSQQEKHYCTWLVVWNMNFIFHNIWDNPSHWRTPSFFKLVIAPPTRYSLLACTMFFCLSRLRTDESPCLSVKRLRPLAGIRNLPGRGKSVAGGRDAHPSTISTKHGSEIHLWTGILSRKGFVFHWRLRRCFK